MPMNSMDPQCQLILVSWNLLFMNYRFFAYLSISSFCYSHFFLLSQHKENHTRMNSIHWRFYKWGHSLKLKCTKTGKHKKPVMYTFVTFDHGLVTNFFFSVFFRNGKVQNRKVFTLILSMGPDSIGQRCLVRI